MTRIEREKNTVETMIRLYCRKKEGNKELCQECQELLDYAMLRLTKCKFGEHKTTCQKCPVHCYKPAMREKISKVMRFSGPRMIIYHPWTAIMHLVLGQAKRQSRLLRRAKPAELERMFVNLPLIFVNFISNTD